MVNSNISAYIIRELVEFRQVGHAEQNKLQAAEEQQQAKLPTVQMLRRAPMADESRLDQ